MTLAAATAAGAGASLLLSSSSRPTLLALPLPRHRRPYRSIASPAASRGNRGRRRLQVRAARTESTGVAVGFRAPQFELPEPLTGKVWTLDDFEGNRALLVMFICNHCPFVKHLKKDIVKLTSFYLEKGLAAVAISSNSVLTHPQGFPSCHQLPFHDDVQERNRPGEMAPNTWLRKQNCLNTPSHIFTMSLKKLLRLLEQSAHQSFTCSKKTGEGHLNCSTMDSLMILDPVTMYLSLEGS